LTRPSHPSNMKKGGFPAGSFLTSRHFPPQAAFYGQAVIPLRLHTYPLLQSRPAGSDWPLVHTHTHQSGWLALQHAYAMVSCLKLALAGTATGLFMACTTARALSGKLFGITASDPHAFAGAGFFLIATALPAGFQPAGPPGWILRSRCVRSDIHGNKSVYFSGDRNSMTWPGRHSPKAF
jgi:hypothetical protein